MAASGSATVSNSLISNYAGLRAAGQLVAAERASMGKPAGELSVPFELPAADAALTSFFDVSDVGLTEIGDRLYLLDLMRNPHTRTTKTLASAVMIARAARHIRQTGERLLLLTPTSGNKGTALRDAIARAYQTGLASPADLRIAMVVPQVSAGKLRESPLSADEALRTASPVMVADVARPADVKGLGSDALARCADEVLAQTGFRLWYTLDVDNYRMADSVRAFVEAELMPITPDSPPRVHAHAVSSAYGLLGYHLGLDLLTSGQCAGLPAPARHPGFYLIQHLATADMVTSLLGVPRPDYERDEASGQWRQAAEPSFPAVTDDVAEVIDPTFYTTAPPTSAQVNLIVKEHGGGGLVISRQECLHRLAPIRDLAANAGIEVTADPAQVREWSLIKGLAGVLVARERRLLDTRAEIVLHASGYYTDELIPPLPRSRTVAVSSADDVARCLLSAAGS